MVASLLTRRTAIDGYPSVASFDMLGELDVTDRAPCLQNFGKIFISERKNNIITDQIAKFWQVYICEGCNLHQKRSLLLHPMNAHANHTTGERNYARKQT